MCTCPGGVNILKAQGKKKKKILKIKENHFHPIIKPLWDLLYYFYTPLPPYHNILCSGHTISDLIGRILYYCAIIPHIC